MTNIINKILFSLLLVFGLKGDAVEKYYIFFKEYKILTTKDIKAKIKNKCVKYDLDYYKVLAIVDLESSFNPNMTNPKSSSKHLFGLLDGTFDWMNRKYKLSYSRGLVDDEIEVAMIYINYLHHKYNGNWRKLLYEYCNEKNYYNAWNKRYIKYKQEESNGTN